MEETEFNQMVKREFEIRDRLKESGLLDSPSFKRCGEGDNVCNCKESKDCGYIYIENEISKL